MEFYKKIDKSFFEYGFTIPEKYIQLFLMGIDVGLGKSRQVSLIWNKKKYVVDLRHVDRKSNKSVHQLRWDKCHELKTLLKKEFIQSYIAIASQNFVAKAAQKYYVTKLTGGTQEVMCFEPTTLTEIKISTFIKIDTPYAELFSKLIDRNVFGWISEEDNNKILTKHTGWFDIDQTPYHEDIVYVVYYLFDSINNEIYIGSAKRLGDRVKPQRSEIPGWNKFRYEIVHPIFHKHLKEIEYHSIMNFARFFKNNGNLSTVGIGDGKLVNKDYKYYLK